MNENSEQKVVTVDSRRRITLPDPVRSHYLMRVWPDGTIVLQPAVIVPLNPED